jgi:CRP/FNR family cyclic AMP-dependent transcriptional regulator
MLEKVSLFAGLTKAELQLLADRAKTKRYRKNTVLIEKGDESSAFYVLLEGRVRVYVADENGKELVLRIYTEPGSHFGELAVLGGRRRTASVETVDDSRLLVITKHDFLQCVTNNAGICQGIIAQLVGRIEELTDRLGHFALHDVYGRLVSVLGELAEEQGDRRLTPPVTQQELAQRIGASREMVSRIFKELRAGGYINIVDRRIELLKKLPARW